MEGQFIAGINYWPKHRAMAWWREFDSSAVERDFSLLSEYRFDIVRIFLLWEEFQPTPSRISMAVLNRLVEAAEIAEEMRLGVLPAFFIGHMMGINWLLLWMLEGGEGDEKFPVFSQGNVQKAAIRNYYADKEIWEAQKLLIREVTNALQGHAVNVIRQLPRERKDYSAPLNWIDLDRQEFWTAPREYLGRIYGRFKEMEY